MLLKCLIRLDRKFRVLPVWLHGLCWATISFASVITLALIAVLLLNPATTTNNEVWGYNKIFFALIAAPIIETGFLLFAIVAGYEISGRKFIGILSGAVFLSFWHGVVAIAWGIAVFPVFFISSLVYLLNRGKPFNKTNIMLIHFYSNFYALMLAYLAGVLVLN